MKILLKVFLLLPMLALAQSAMVPIMGTAPVQPSPRSTVSTPAAGPATAPPAKRAQKSPATQAMAKPRGEVVPPPSQVTKDFYLAFARDNLPLADLLIQQGANVNCRNCGDRTPIMLKISQGDVEAVRWIIARGADVNLPGMTSDGLMSPLMSSVLRRSALRVQESVFVLLQSGSDPNWKDIEGNTPFLMWAGRDLSDDHRIKGLVAMLGRGAEINHANNMGQTALMQAIVGSANCSPQSVRFLLGRGADASKATVDGKTAAIYAYQQALKGNTQCNQVMAILKSPPQPAADAPVPVGGQEMGQRAASLTSAGGFPTGQWQGVFNATTPRSASVGTTATISSDGDVAFVSQAGMRGAGRLSVAGDRVSGTVTAVSPLDADGRPIITNPDGSTDIIFRLNGTLADGVMQGSYASSVESGNFAMCAARVYDQTTVCKPVQPSLGDLMKAVGGLLGSLKGLSEPSR
ncbi:MAG: hypothetical protein Q8K38_07585 [Burkholderiaceae bacterium]|nr:hypothetical protein [Burkholderiaceae bacterium]MDZ4146609.1 hypothetical protein [Burkholderiales bacterium]